jgi:hypothetical protein
VVRPPIARRDFSDLVKRLNELEDKSEGKWKIDNDELASAIKFASSDGSPVESSLTPETVADETRTALRQSSASSASGALS